MADLLPPNATPLERALAGATGRLDGAAVDLAPVMDPATAPVELLPWLAWGESVDIWDPDWSEAQKRVAVATSILIHRTKGTRYAVETTLERIDALAQVVEWHEAQPRLAPHTFEIRMPFDGAGGSRATAAFAEAIMRDIARVKPLREHLVFVQQFAAAARIGIQAAGRAVLALRLNAVAVLPA